MIYYLGIANLPSKRAHAVQEMKMCEAFSEAGEEVTYLHYNVIGEDTGKVSFDGIADYYGLETEFEIKTFRSLHQKTGQFTKLGTISWVGPMTVYVFAQALLGRLSGDDVIYGREYYPIYFLLELLRLLPEHRRPSVYFEQHTPTSKRFLSQFYRRVDGVISITERLAEYLEAKHPIERERIFVAPDGVDPDSYEGWTKNKARKKVGFPQSELIVMYTGHLYKGKGVETLVCAAKELDATVYVVGGYEEDINRVKRRCGHPENVVFTGFVKPSEIPIYQIAADVLVAPYTSQSRPWVSPLKLFEYMAAGRPIVASDRKVLQEVLVDRENSILFKKGDADALHRALNCVIKNDRLADRIAQQANEELKQYTWKYRAERILSFHLKRATNRDRIPES